METNFSLIQKLTVCKKMRGFSLIELMVVVAIIAILAAIALPSYRDYVSKAARADAKTVMLNLAQAEERYYSNQIPPVYLAMPAPPTNTAVTMGPTWINWSGGESIGDRKYSISITLDPASMTDNTTAGSKQSYLIEAVPIAANWDPPCGTLRLYSNGRKTATGALGSGCW